jgi:hypothetical protein
LRDAFYVATHAASRQDGHIRIGPASAKKSDEAEFIMLHDGRIVFEGNASELRAVAEHDDYIARFLS